MKKILILSFAALHLAVILYANIINEEQALTLHFKGKNESGKALSLLQKSPKLYKAFDIYGHYTGAETGYGFYAPNVCSQVIFMFTVLDKNNRPIFTDQIPFHTREAYIRSTRIGGSFLTRPPEKDNIQNKYLSALVKSMALWALDTHPGGHKVMASLLLYNIPTDFKAIKNNTKANYIKIEQYAYSL